MDKPKDKARRKWAKASDWLAVMPTIKRLYKDEKKTLKEVIDIMEAQHGFYATFVYPLSVDWCLSIPRRFFSPLSLSKNARRPFPPRLTSP